MVVFFNQTETKLPELMSEGSPSWSDEKIKSEKRCLVRLNCVR